MKTKTGENKNKKRFKRNVCLWTLAALFTGQIFQPLAWAIDSSLEWTAQGPQILIPVSAGRDPGPEVLEQIVPGVVDPLKPLSRTVNTEAKILESKNTVRDLEEYSFEDALDYLRPDLASAVIVRSLGSRDLRRLTELGFEVGIAVLHGKVVLFTSGNEDEIRILPAAKGLLEKASLMAHVHPKGQRGKPSLTDIQEAGKRVEYVVSEEGVYSYSQKGLKSEYPRDYGWFSRKLATLQNEAASGKKARDLLNTFIKSMDDYNNDKAASVLLRSGDPVTIFPGQPLLTTTAAGGYITVDQYSSSHFRMNYATGGISGNSVQAGINFGASASGPQNLNGLSKITFELKFHTNCASPSNWPCAGIRFVDADNRVSTIYLRDTLRTVFTQTDITRAQILAANPSIDLTRVKQINFFISEGIMAEGGSTTFLEVKTGGLVYLPFSPEGYPIVRGQVFDLTKTTTLPHYPTLSTQAQNGAVITQGQYSSKYYYFNYKVTDADDLATSRINFPSPQNLGSAVTLALSGPTGRQLKVQVIDAAGRVANYYLNPQGFTQNFTIPLTGPGLPLGFDPSKIARIQFVMDKAHAGSFYNNSERVYIQTKGLAFVAAGLPYSQTDLTHLPGQPVVRSSAANGGTVTQSQTSSRNFSFTYNVAAAGTTVMSEISWGQFVNGAFQGVPGPCGSNTGKIVLAVNGPAGKRIKVQLVDANNNTADYLLNLTGTPQNYHLITSAQFSGIDMNRLAAIRFIPESAQTGASGTITVETSGLFYDPNAGTKPSVTEITTLPGNPTNNTIVPAGATASIAPTSRGFVLGYNTGTAGWGGGGFNYDNFSTPAIETGDLSAYRQLIFGLKGSPSRVKLEVIDDQNKKAVVYLEQVNKNGVENVWAVPTADLRAQGVDLARVRMIYFIIEGINQSGTLEINRVPLPVQPTEAAIQPLPGKSRVVRVAPAGVIANELTISRGARLEFQTGTPGWAGVGFTYDDPLTSAVESANLTGLPYLGFGIKGDTTQIKLELVDANNRKASVKLTGVRSYLELRWAISLLPFEAYGIDLTRIQTLYFIVEGQNQNGTIEIYRL